MNLGLGIFESFKKPVLKLWIIALSIPMNYDLDHYSKLIEFSNMTRRSMHSERRTSIVSLELNKDFSRRAMLLNA